MKIQGTIYINVYYDGTFYCFSNKTSAVFAAGPGCVAIAAPHELEREIEAGYGVKIPEPVDLWKRLNGYEDHEEVSDE
jgi:hypothetical protein